MQCLDLTLPTPAENLALDEALLEAAESGAGGEMLRFWESPLLFVVLGAGGVVLDDVDVETCRNYSLPILRRCSGGGTVLQGPGCLNYTLVLRKDAHPQVKSIDGTYRLVLGSVVQAVRAAGIREEVEIGPPSDLAIAGMKFSGNAQRHKKHAVLMHGTLLHHFDLGSVARFLTMPKRQPAYRAGRNHGDFVMNLDVSPGNLKRELMKAWNVTEFVADWPRETVERLAAKIIPL